MSERSALGDVAKKWISLWNVPVNWQLFDALHAASFENLSPADRIGTKQAFAQGLSDLTQAFPDLRTTVEDLVIDVDRGDCRSSLVRFRGKPKTVSGRWAD